MVGRHVINLEGGTVRDGFRQDRGVEDVSVPEPRRLSRADQSVCDAGVGQDGDELFRELESVTEDGGSGRGCLRRLDRFGSILGHALILQGVPAGCCTAASFHVKRGAVTPGG